MWSDVSLDQGAHRRRRIERLLDAHRQRHTLLIVIALAVVGFIAWASVFEIDEVARARGEVIT